eukprot:1188454-Pleurochrysis_carterae.AAC.1
MRRHQEPRWILGVAADRGLSARSESRHRPRHRSAASPRLRYADCYGRNTTHNRVAAARSTRDRTAARRT